MAGGLRGGPFGCDLFFDTIGWSLRGVPLTLRVGDRNWGPSQEVCDALASLGNGDPTRLIVHERHVYLPIRPPLGVERDQVLDGIVAQIMPVARVAASLASGSGPPSGVVSAVNAGSGQT